MLLATTYPAGAGTLTYTLATITGPELTLVTPVAGPSMAGLIHLTTASGTVEAWCVDLPDALAQAGGTYNVGSSAALNGSPGAPALTADQIGEIGALARHGASLVHNPGAYTSDQVAAAIQISIWEVEYGATAHTGFTYRPTLGSPIDTAPPSPAGLVAQFLANVGPGNPWGEYSGFKVLYTNASTNNQTLVTSVPEPSTWATMLAGFASLGIAGYRRRLASRTRPAV